MRSIKLVDKEHAEKLVDMLGLWKAANEMSRKVGVVTFETIWRVLIKF